MVYEVPDVMADPRALAAVDAALAEDIGPGDVTTRALVDPGIVATGVVLAREACRVAGAEVGRRILQRVDPAIRVQTVAADGSTVEAGGAILTFQGPACSILTAERTTLNFMQRMCGIATLTGRFVDAVREYGTQILDTRKTTPNLRLFEKHAVGCGGCVNHRFGLYVRVLVKDNHRRLWQGGDPARLDLAVLAARQAFPGLAVEIEVETVEECENALRGRPEWILLDNMDCERMRACVRLCRGLCRTEASGGITLQRVREVAATGVDAVSLGCLTHSAGAIDLSLEWSSLPCAVS